MDAGGVGTAGGIGEVGVERGGGGRAEQWWGGERAGGCSVGRSRRGGAAGQLFRGCGAAADQRQGEHAA
eukprot:3362153-Prymnesium_polylepis.1